MSPFRFYLFVFTCCTNRTIQIFRKYCLGDMPVRVQVCCCGSCFRSKQTVLYANGYSNRFWVINHKISRLRMVGWTTRTQTMQSDFRFLRFTEITMILCVKDMNRYWACHRCMQPILIILNLLCRKPRLIACTTLFPPPCSHYLR